MNSERWQRIKQLLYTAVERPPGERTKLLDERCRGDTGLRNEVQALLEAHDQSEGLFESPAVELMAETFAQAEEVPMPDIIGSSLGHYQVIKHIGTGGMGEVFLAEDILLGRRVAIKLLSAARSPDEQSRERFIREAKAASALNHPNILTIYETGFENNKHFIASEFVQGQTLRQKLDSRAVDVANTIDLALQVASALEAAHEASIVHRDLKPENIMIRDDGLVKVLDFGLAKLSEKFSAAPVIREAMFDAPDQVTSRTAEGLIIGTPCYMSPEQARGGEVDTRSDIFALGSVLYEMLSGRKAFDGDTVDEVIGSVLRGEPVDLLEAEIPPALSKVLGKCLNKDRNERYQTVKSLSSDLRQIKHAWDVKHSGTQTDLASSGERSVNVRPHNRFNQLVRDQISSRRRLVMIAAAALTVIIGPILFWYINATRAAPLTEQDTIVLADFDNTTGDAAFDGTLKQALAIQLEQSPFLNIFSDQRVREVLRFMNRSPDERVTNEMAREICERQGLKAYLSGSISNHGTHYVITLEAVNTQTGDVIAREQVETQNKEQVISALGGAATKLREKLGESLTSIEKYDAPIQEVTTSSLEALKAYSMGLELDRSVKMNEAIPFYKRAVELDPNFALAYADLSEFYNLTGQRELGYWANQKAFELRDRVSERERLEIVANYYKWSSDLAKCVEANEMLTRIYPREWVYWDRLGYIYLEIGRTEEAVEPFREAIRLYPNAYPYWGLGYALTRLNRFDEAKEILDQALTLSDHPLFHSGLYSIAFIKDDAGAMQQQVDWANTRPEQLHLIWQGNAAAFSGQLRKARDFYHRVIEIEQRNNKEYSNKQLAALHSALIPFLGAITGSCKNVKEDIAKSLAIMSEDAAKWRSAVALALCGETAQAESLLDEFAERNVKGTAWVPPVPAARAAIEIRRGNPARATELLESANVFTSDGYEHQASIIVLWNKYLRGVAYLDQKEGVMAAAEFQTILDHRGMIPIGIHYPLAHLGMARAAVLSADMVKARKYYLDFFELWKDADSDIPILQQAKIEFGKLK